MYNRNDIKWYPDKQYANPVWSKFTFVHNPPIFYPVLSITANGYPAHGFAICKAISYPLQDPIKNLIGHPE